MVLFDGAFGLILIGVWLFAIIDSITSDESRVRNLPKWAWILITILLSWVGAVIWFVAGRPRGSGPALGNRASFDGRRRSDGKVLAPDDDPEYLAMLQRRVEEQRRRARETGTDQEA